MNWSRWSAADRQGCPPPTTFVASGFRVTIFDQNAELGGMLRYAIPAYRLPRDILDAEIARLLATGITFEPHRKLGRDIHLGELRQSFAAVFLGPGCQKPRDWTVEGADTVDSPTGLDLLLEWLNFGSLAAKGKRVVVHGGGNTAIDVSRILKWAGAAEVHVVAASSLPGSPGAPAADIMAAFPREVEQAEEEGVVFHPHHTLSRLIVRNGHVAAAEIAAVGKVAGRDHRTRRVTFTGTENIISADLVVPAIGEVVDPAGFNGTLGRDGIIAAETDGMVGGDGRGVCRRRRARQSRHGDGGDRRRATRGGGDRSLPSRRGPANESPPSTIGPESLNLAYFLPAARQEGVVLPVDARSPDEEIEGGLARGAFLNEASRCFSCGSCLACDNCWTFCPEPAVLKTAATMHDGSRYVFDYDYCKGCGICARECPTGFIAMVDE